MKISQDVRKYAADKGLDAETALAAGMQEKSAEFLDEGARVYLPVVELEQAVTSTEPAAVD